MALILGGIVAIGTVVVLVLIIGADMMSDNPSASISPVPTAVIGFGLAAILIASHWGPHIGW
jgi:hypothetical protein